METWMPTQGLTIPCNTGHFGIIRINEDEKGLLGLSLIQRPLHHQHISLNKAQSQSLLVTPPRLVASISRASLSLRDHHWIATSQGEVTSSASWDMDHSLVGSKVHLQSKRMQNWKQKGCPHIEVTTAATPDLHDGFAKSIGVLPEWQTDNVASRWNHI